jgi:hypothetical protein
MEQVCGRFDGGGNPQPARGRAGIRTIAVCFHGGAVNCMCHALRDRVGN